ncbi:hypothetical protein [Bradyrhizobium sp. LM6.9]
MFGLALEALDFTVRPILCRVRMGAPEGGPRTHHALIVDHRGLRLACRCRLPRSRHRLHRYESMRRSSK